MPVTSAGMSVPGASFGFGRPAVAAAAAAPVPAPVPGGWNAANNPNAGNPSTANIPTGNITMATRFQELPAGTRSGLDAVEVAIRSQRRRLAGLNGVGRAGGLGVSEGILQSKRAVTQLGSRLAVDGAHVSALKRLVSGQLRVAEDAGRGIDGVHSLTRVHHPLNHLQNHSQNHSQGLPHDDPALAFFASLCADVMARIHHYRANIDDLAVAGQAAPFSTHALVSTLKSQDAFLLAMAATVAALNTSIAAFSRDYIKWRRSMGLPVPTNSFTTSNSTTNSTAPLPLGDIANQLRTTVNGKSTINPSLYNTSAQGASMFGVGAKPASSLFGSQPQGSLFGNSTQVPQAQGSIFGGAATTVGGGSLFGISSQAPQTQSLFGTASQAPQAQSLFGGASQAQGLLGAQQPTIQGGLFNTAQPTTTPSSLFNTTTTNLFAPQQQNLQPTTTLASPGAGYFGSKRNKAGLSVATANAPTTGFGVGSTSGFGSGFGFTK